MNEFKFDYDEDSDDLLVYVIGRKSGGGVEIGNFVVDFDENEEIVGLEILDAKATLSKILSRIVNFNDIRRIELSAKNFRNMASIRMNIVTDDFTESTNIVLPRIVEHSPALGY